MIRKLKDFFFKDKEWAVAEKFGKSKLGGKGMVFKNDVGMLLYRDKKNKYECITEIVSTLEHCSDSLPEGSKINFSALQVVVETKEELTTDQVQALENLGFQYQSAIVPFEKGEVWQTTLFAQDPNYWSQDFEEFLKTYHEFRRKKYEDKVKN